MTSFFKNISYSTYFTLSATAKINCSSACPLTVNILLSMAQTTVTNLSLTINVPIFPLIKIDFKTEAFSVSISRFVDVSYSE